MVKPESSGSDLLGYAVGIVVLVVGGFFLRTPVLNWICGPALVVLSVVIVGRIRDRLAQRLAGRRTSWKAMSSSGI